MKGLKEVAGKEVIIDGQTYKVHQAGDSGIVIQKQVAPGQFKSLSAAEMDGLSSAELVGLTDHIYGPGKAGILNIDGTSKPAKKSSSSPGEATSDSALTPKASPLRL
jgi:hypothetical protein